MKKINFCTQILCLIGIVLLAGCSSKPIRQDSHRSSQLNESTIYTSSMSKHERVKLNKHISVNEVASNVKTSPLYWASKYYFESVKPHLYIPLAEDSDAEQLYVHTISDFNAWKDFLAFYRSLNSDQHSLKTNSAIWLHQRSGFAGGYFYFDQKLIIPQKHKKPTGVIEVMQKLVKPKPVLPNKAVHNRLKRSILTNGPNAPLSPQTIGQCNPLGLTRFSGHSERFENYINVSVVENTNVSRDVYRCSGPLNATVDHATWSSNGLTTSAMIFSETSKDSTVSNSVLHSSIYLTDKQLHRPFEYYMNIRKNKPSRYIYAFQGRSIDSKNDFSIYIGERNLLIEIKIPKKLLNLIHSEHQAFNIENIENNYYDWKSPSDYRKPRIYSTLNELRKNFDADKFVDTNRLSTGYLQRVERLFDDWADINGWEIEELKPRTPK